MNIPFTKMHGLGNDYVYVNTLDVDLTDVDVSALTRRVSDRHRGIGSDGLILIAPPTDGIDADIRMEMYNADGSRGEMCGNGIRCVAKFALDRGLSARTDGVSGLQRNTYANARTGEVPPPSGSNMPADSIAGKGVAARHGMDANAAGVETLTPGVSHKKGEGAVQPTLALHTLAVQTDRGVLMVDAFAGDDGKIERVRVDMGVPILVPREIPTTLGDASRCVAASMQIDDRSYSTTCVSMGNPHAVTFVDDVPGFNLEKVGPLVERHAAFAKRVNFHVVQIHARNDATMRTWERGSGITQACGTGACAVLVAGVLENRMDRNATLYLPGGELLIEWPADAASVFMTGPAEEVFSGMWSLRA